MMSNEDLFQYLLERMSGLDYVHPEDVPNIDLYMDQLTTFMDQHLEHSKRHPDDKILTKTMINNYTKNDLLPPPVKKKYSREHLLLLIFIYYYKSILSIGDIQTLLKPIADKYFHAPTGLTLTDIYDDVFSLENEQVERLKQDIRQCFKTANQSFPEAENDEERTKLQRFAFISMLGFDIYIKKQVIERLIDEMAADASAAKPPKKSAHKTDAEGPGES